MMQRVLILRTISCRILICADPVTTKIESLAHHFIIIFLGVLAVGFFSAFSPGAGRINSDRQTRYNS